MTDKKKKGGPEEDISTDQFLKVYKKKCDQLSVPICKIFKDKIDLAISEGDHLYKLHIWEELGPIGVRTIMESASDVIYKHLKSIRLWKVKAEDEGVRTIYIFIEKVKTHQILDLLDNNLG